MGLTFLSRWARGPMPSMGIDPARKCARDTMVFNSGLFGAERAGVSRWARGPMPSMGIDPARKSTGGKCMACVVPKAESRRNGVLE
jgi:hypothetical protein